MIWLLIVDCKKAAGGIIKVSELVFFIWTLYQIMSQLIKHSFLMVWPTSPTLFSKDHTINILRHHDGPRVEGIGNSLIFWIAFIQ